MTTIILADLRARGVALSTYEAVAIVQALIHSDQSPSDAQPPYGPPTNETVTIDADGMVACLTSAATPAVSEVAILLQDLLSMGTIGVPRALRFALARALLEVEAPPFDSIEEFSRTLERFEGGDRRRLIRDLYQRAVSTKPAMTTPVVPFSARDRRPLWAGGSEEQRDVRDLDRQLPEQQHADVAPAVAPARVPWFRRRVPIAACLAAGLFLILACELLHVWQSRLPTTVRAPQPVAGGQQSAGNRQPSATVPEQSTVTGRARIGARPPAMIESLGAIDDHQSSVNIRQEPVGGSTVAAPNRSSLQGRRQGVDRSSARQHHSTGNSRPGAREALPADDSERPGPAESPIGQPVDSGPRAVFSPAFASNGTAIFSHSGENAGEAPSALMSLGSASADLRVMTIVDDGARNYHVQPSPSGKLIAFDSDRDGTRGVYVAAHDGSGVRRVSGAGYAAVPTWSPKGERLAFSRAESGNSRVWNLWLLGLDTGEMRRLTSFTYGQTWSASWFADGQRIVYTHEDRVIVQDLASGRTEEYASPVKHRLVRTPAVSPDGTKIVFQVHRSGAWLLDLTDGSMRCVLTDPTAEEFAWAPDGRRVAFHSRRDGQWGIWMMSGT
jgi:hypothetical protein